MRLLRFVLGFQQTVVERSKQLARFHPISDLHVDAGNAARPFCGNVCLLLSNDRARSGE
jgi:hypothetical protein